MQQRLELCEQQQANFIPKVEAEAEAHMVCGGCEVVVNISSWLALTLNPG